MVNSQNDHHLLLHRESVLNSINTFVRSDWWWRNLWNKSGSSMDLIRSSSSWSCSCWFLLSLKVWLVGFRIWGRWIEKSLLSVLGDFSERLRKARWMGMKLTYKFWSLKGIEDELKELEIVFKLKELEILFKLKDLEILFKLKWWW